MGCSDPCRLRAATASCATRVAAGPAAEAADFAVINTGLHSHGPLEGYLGGVKQTFAKLTAMYARRGQDPARHLLYRSSWAALVGCGNVSDPLTPAEAIEVFRRQGRLTTNEDRYNWSSLSPQNEGVRALAASFGVPFWNVYPATLMRPGGHRLKRITAKNDDHVCRRAPNRGP